MNDKTQDDITRPLDKIVMRYFVDERIGCIAVRDRTKTDPEYNGLHEDTEGVVQFWEGIYTNERCPTCGTNLRTKFTVSEEAIKEARALCDHLNHSA